MINVTDPKWDAPLTQAQWNACKWLFEDGDNPPLTDAQRDRLAAPLADETEAAA
jgi:hypothetical protein